jgi:dUTP pyrophosphatase
MKVAIQRLAHAQDLPLPAYATVGAAGLDLFAALKNELVLAPGRHAAIPTGIAIAIPEAYEAQVRPRSGLALRHGVTVLNAPGTVDSDYRGEVTAILINLGSEPFAIARGMKIAQLVVAAHARVEWMEPASLDNTQRGAGGFGSTGLKL